MSRRSTRLLESKTKHTAPQVIRELGSSEEIDDVSESLPVSKISTSRSKRRKTAKTSASAKEDTGKPRKKRGRQGILQDIQDAPLDILFEVCFSHILSSDHVAVTDICYGCARFSYTSSR